MSEYKMSHTGAELDEAIAKVLNGYVLPVEIINIDKNVSNMDITNGKILNVNVPSGITPIGNLTDALIARSSNIDNGHRATIPAGYYVNSAFTISEWKSGILTGNGSSGGTFVVPYSSIGFIPSYAVLVALEPNNSNLANTVLAAFGNGASAYSAVYMYTGAKASLSATYPINSTYNTIKLNSSGITFSGLSGVKYGTCNYRWFALR